MGILPLMFIDGQNAKALGLNGREMYTIKIEEQIDTKQIVEVLVNETKAFIVEVCILNELELNCFKNGGIFHQFTKQALNSSA